MQGEQEKLQSHNSHESRLPSEHRIVSLHLSCPPDGSIIFYWYFQACLVGIKGEITHSSRPKCFSKIDFVSVCWFGFSCPSVYWMFSKWLHPSSTLINSGSLFRWSSPPAFPSSLVSRVLYGVANSLPIVHDFFVWCVLHVILIIVLSAPRRHPRVSYDHGHGDVSGVSLRWVWWIHF